MAKQETVRVTLTRADAEVELLYHRVDRDAIEAALPGMARFGDAPTIDRAKTALARHTREAAAIERALNPTPRKPRATKTEEAETDGD